MSYVVCAVYLQRNYLPKNTSVRLEVLTVMKKSMLVSRVVDTVWTSALKTEEGRSYRTLASTYKSTVRYNPDQHRLLYRH
jgi:hypothetical protein